MSCSRGSKGQADQSMQERCSTRRNHRSFLRLNSTGDVTAGADSLRSKCKTISCNRNSRGSTPEKASTSNGDPYLRNIVGNLNMCSIIESAANYIESWAPKDTVSRNLTKNTNPNQSLGFIKSIFTTDNTKMSTGMLDNKVNCVTVGQGFDNNMNKMPASSCPSWSCGSFLGAIQSGGFLSNCATKNSTKMAAPNVRLYVPPQRRKLMGDDSRKRVSVNPKLTPYNAKLLEKSKTSHAQVEKQSNIPVEDKKVEGKKEHLPASATVLTQDNTMKSSEPKKQTVTEEPTVTEDSSSTTDWFEYECTDNTIIPITISEEKLHSCLKQCTGSIRMPNSPEKVKPLHNWFSVELDGEVKKSEQSKSANSSQTDKRNAQCKVEEKHAGNDRHCDVKNIDNKTGPHSKGTETERANGQKKSCMKSKHAHEQTDHLKTNGEDVARILYERSCGKKSRPSKKKRNRQKAQTGQGNQNLKPGSAVHPRSPVAFILGVNAKSSENTHSFQFTCDIDSVDFDSVDFDSDSEFSSEDSDDNFSSLDDDEILGLRCNDPIGSFGLYTLSCSIQPTSTKQSPSSTTQSPSSPASKEIEDINQLWQVHISIKPDETKQHSSAKKVHFADDKDLATVHPIVAWRFAYAAARKGPWEEYARDRARFQRRVTEMATVLNPILSADHRSTIYEGRFSDDSSM